MKCPFCNKTELKILDDGRLKCDDCMNIILDMEGTKRFIEYFRNPTHDNFTKMIELI